MTQHIESLASRVTPEELKSIETGASIELAKRAIPPVVSWGPAQRQELELDTPEGLTYSA